MQTFKEFIFEWFKDREVMLIQKALSKSLNPTLKYYNETMWNYYYTKFLDAYAINLRNLATDIRNKIENALEQKGVVLKDISEESLLKILESSKLFKRANQIVENWWSIIKDNYEYHN